VPHDGALARALQRAWWSREPGLLSRVLQPVAGLARAVAAARRALVRPQRVGVPVIVVGNLVVGGAGKTPTTIALVRLLRAYGWTPGIVSRGYGRRSDTVAEVHADDDPRERGDEPLLLHLRTGAPVVVGRDRVAAACALLDAYREVDILVSDDGLQHHRLARDAQVIVFDERGVGNGLLLPAGPLRERLPGGVRPDTLPLYNAPEPSTPLPGWMATRVMPGVLPLADWSDGAALPLLASAGDGFAPLRGRRVLAAAGIAVPERFFAGLRAQGLEFEPLPLPDHHAFDTLPWAADTPDVVVTEKDAVKLRHRDIGATRIWVAPLDLVPDLGFAAAVKRLFPKPD
jgi:tetraacyldisaccharide 4'-kinase